MTRGTTVVRIEIPGSGTARIGSARNQNSGLAESPFFAHTHTLDSSIYSTVLLHRNMFFRSNQICTKPNIHFRANHICIKYPF